MKRYKKLFALLLIILCLGFIVFVVIMQQKFNNPEFVDTSAAQASVEEAPRTEISDNGSAAGAASSLINEDNKNDKDEENAEEDTSTITKVVAVELLGVRSEPSTDSPITGTLVFNQSVEVENGDDEWVKVFTDEFTGYVENKYLSEE